MIFKLLKENMYAKCIFNLKFLINQMRNISIGKIILFKSQLNAFLKY